MVDIYCDQDSISLQAFDRWHALKQSQGKNIDARFLRLGNAPRHDAMSILLTVMPERAISAHYDLVIISNEGEPIMVGTPAMVEMLKRPNTYLMCNSQVTIDHPLHSKIIWWPDDMTKCRDFWTRPYYPQYHALQALRAQHHMRQPIIGIGGQSKSWRHEFFRQLNDCLPDLPTTNRLGAQVLATTDSQWESIEDQRFRDWVNEQVDVDRSLPISVYYDQAVPVGIGGKFGMIPPGYFVMPEYFEYQCVIYPESTWQNNEVCVTEKSLKCFYANTIPMPVGGAGLNKLYNVLGFQTAWNLLPKELQVFDSVLDHRQRYQDQIQAIKWLWNNTDILTSTEAHSIRQNNFEQFMIGDCEYRAAQQLDNVIAKHERRH